ncbi:MAG: ParB/RepB/Spo0J family partition protein [Acidobacteria bacterium]|nr:ParB/RepB/Spo0J family partition protein [Acidobacteriota bacterium]
MERRPALGKGLSALIPEVPEQPKQGAIEIDVDLLSPNDQQPRLSIDDVKLDELAASIKANGVIQPILVRRFGSAFKIIAGERRWRAAQRAGLLKVPVVVRDVAEGSDRNLLELALVENIQRENLNPVDEAIAYQRLSDEFGLTQEQIAEAVGKDRATVANFLRLLRLPEEIRGALAGGALSMGHARAILALADDTLQRQAARDVVSQALSVRDTEALVRKLGAPARVRRTPQPAEPADVHTRAAEDRIRFALGTKARIVRRGQGGTIEIDFGSEDELNRLYEMLTSQQPTDPNRE